MTGRPYRALFVHSANELYGADTVLLSLLESHPAEWEPHVVLPCDVPYEGLLAKRLSALDISWEEMKLAVLRRRYLTPRRVPLYAAYFASSTIRLLRLIRRKGVQVVHSNTSAVVPGAVAARLAGVPHIWHVHEMVVRPHWLRRILAALVPALSDIVIAVSGAVRDHILSTNPAASNIRVIHNGIDVQTFQKADSRDRVRDEFGFTPDNVVAVTMGRLSQGKGQFFLLDAAARIADEVPSLRFLLVGSPFVGQEHLVEELHSRIEVLGLRRCVEISGYRSDVPDILAASDICVLPSTLPDSFPTVVLEAMAAGKPVVATNWGGSREMVVDGETGYLVPVDDASVMADRLRLLAESPDLRRQMGEAGQRRAEELFTRERMVREFWTLMEEVVQKRSAT